MKAIRDEEGLLVHETEPHQDHEKPEIAKCHEGKVEFIDDRGETEAEHELYPGRLRAELRPAVTAAAARTKIRDDRDQIAGPERMPADITVRASTRDPLMMHEPPRHTVDIAPEYRPEQEREDEDVKLDKRCSLVHEAPFLKTFCIH